MKSFLGIARFVFVAIGALVLTTLAIDATDTLDGAGGSMLASIIGSKEMEICPSGMTHVPAGKGFSCVDTYEATAASDCPHPQPATERETAANIADTKCQPEGENTAVLPWRSVKRSEAALLCTRAGKRLPTAEEWYQFAIGTPDAASSCNIESGKVQSGQVTDCQSAAGVYNTVGNVWEWVTDDVFDGQYKGRSLPQQGYVTSIDSGGVATETGSEASDVYQADYFWSLPEGAFGVMRGGFYGSQSDAGVQAVHAASKPEFVGEAVGFRCVQ